MEPQQVTDSWEEIKGSIDAVLNFIGDGTGLIDRSIVWLLTNIPDWAHEIVGLIKGIIALVRGQLGV